MQIQQSNAQGVYFVRADFGRYASDFQQKGYVAISWLPQLDLSEASLKGRQFLADHYSEFEPGAGINRKGQNVGQILRFLDELLPGAYVLTPRANREELLIGTVTGNYYYETNLQGCPFPHRKPVEWKNQVLQRSGFSIPLQNTLGSPLSVYAVSQVEEVLAYVSNVPMNATKPLQSPVVQEVKARALKRLAALSADDFEILITQLLAAIGFEAQHVGRVGDGGIDVRRILDVRGFARVDLEVQVKRYERTLITPQALREFRGSVRERAQAAFVTLSDFSVAARKEALREGAKPIGLINGSQLVDLLINHHNNLTLEMQQQLLLRDTLMPE